MCLICLLKLVSKIASAAVLLHSLPFLWGSTMVVTMDTSTSYTGLLVRATGIPKLPDMIIPQ